MNYWKKKAMVEATFGSGADVPSLDEIVRKIEARTTRPRLLKIGAMDGIRYDQVMGAINKERWDGVLVEPIPDWYAALTDNYRMYPELKTVNCAVSDRRGQVEMRYVPAANISSSGLPEWVSGISSLEKKRGPMAGAGLGTLTLGELAPHLRSIRVRAVTLSELKAEVGMPSFEMIAIDTEGHDAVVLRQVDFEDRLIQGLVFEFVHMTESELAWSLERLRQAGFAAAARHYDVIACRLARSGQS